MDFDEHTYTFLFVIYLIVELLGHRQLTHSALTDPKKGHSKAVIHIFIPPAEPRRSSRSAFPRCFEYISPGYQLGGSTRQSLLLLQGSGHTVCPGKSSGAGARGRGGATSPWSHRPSRQAWLLPDN